jgi:hypothetical protein
MFVIILSIGMYYVTSSVALGALSPLSLQKDPLSVNVHCYANEKKIIVGVVYMYENMRLSPFHHSRHPSVLTPCSYSWWSCFIVVLLFISCRPISALTLVFEVAPGDKNSGRKRDTKIKNV